MADPTLYYFIILSKFEIHLLPCLVSYMIFHYIQFSYLDLTSCSALLTNSTYIQVPTPHKLVTPDKEHHAR